MRTLLEILKGLNKKANINEAFNSSILSKIATKIKTTGRKFSEFFGPVIMTKGNWRYGQKVKVRGIKWDQITDNDFVHFEGGYDPKCAAWVRKIFKQKINGILVACDDETHEIIYLIRGFNVLAGKPSVWAFDTDYKGAPLLKGVKAKAYKYQDRDLNADEALEYINDYEIYALEITQSMIEEYNTIITDRAAAREGVINYDEKSLQEILQQNRTRLKQLAEKRKAEKLAANDNMLEQLDELNAECMEFVHQAMNSERYLSRYSYLGNILSYFNDTVDYYYRYCEEKHDVEKTRINLAKENVPAEEIEGTVRYTLKSAQEYLLKCEEGIKLLRKRLEEARQYL